MWWRIDNINNIRNAEGRILAGLNVPNDSREARLIVNSPELYMLLNSVFSVMLEADLGKGLRSEIKRLLARIDGEEEQS